MKMSRYFLLLFSALLTVTGCGINSSSAGSKTGASVTKNINYKWQAEQGALARIGT